MNKEYGKKLSAIIIATFLLPALAAGHALAWGSATHAYIDDHLGRKGPARNLNEIYGGMAADAFAYLFSNPNWLNYLYFETHYENNLLVWKKADTILEKAAAFGFVSHGGMIGADATAHGTYDYGAPDGWVIAKAAAMAENPSIRPILSGFGLTDEHGGVSWAGYELCHIFIESAVDLLLAQHDRSLGGKISAAALLRAHGFQDVLVNAYAKGFKENFNLDRQTAVAVIRSAENEFRKNMVSYGFALAQEPAAAQELLAGQMAALAPAFLSAYGIALPDNEDEEAHLNELSGIFLNAAIKMCRGGYLEAVEDTIAFVTGNLANMGINY
jgi:hypothetical protein